FCICLILTSIICTLSCSTFVSYTTLFRSAAEIDGCNKAQTIFKVILPLSLPSLVSTGLYAFINAWNEFMFGYIFISTDQYRTLTDRKSTRLNSSHVSISYALLCLNKTHHF